MEILIKSNETEITAFIEEESFADKLRSELPIETEARTWGEEVYFSVPVEDDLAEDATDVVDPGTVTYWVQGNAIAIPYGPTPASVENECRLASEVNPIGSLNNDPDELDNITSGDEIVLTEA